MQRARIPVTRVRGIRWCFTINNYSDEEVEAVKRLERYCLLVICSKEKGKEGTPHLQGYAEFGNRIDGGKVKKLLGGRAHIEIARGTRQDNIKYCSKEGEEAIIAHKMPRKKTYEMTTSEKIQATFNLLMDIRTMDQDEFEMVHPAFFLNNKSKYLDHKHDALVMKQKTWSGDLKKKNFWIWGQPGVGKSRMARQGLDHWKVFSKPFNKWWNGFNLERTKRVVIDDWPDMDHGGDMLCQHLKVWADRYPFTGEIKGSHLAIEPKFQLIITSNYSIEQCFKNPEDVAAIKRRISEHEMKGDGTLDPHLVLPMPDEEEEEEEKKEEEDSIVEEE